MDLLDKKTALDSLIDVKNRDHPLGKCGYKITSQQEEDGIIEEILYRIGISSPTFVELGADSQAFENNSCALAMRGCKGVWIDVKEPLISGNPEKLLLITKLITLENIDEIMNQCLDFVGSSPNLLSIDLDGNDYYILEKIVGNNSFDCIVCEYNGNWGKYSTVYSDYSEVFERDNGDYYGMSLNAAIDLLNDYTLVCCNITGVNAFFVHNRHRRYFADCITANSNDQFMPPTPKYYNFRTPGSLTTLKSFYKHQHLCNYDQ